MHIPSSVLLPVLEILDETFPASHVVWTIEHELLVKSAEKALAVNNTSAMIKATE
jgi:hypothetical protein